MHFRKKFIICSQAPPASPSTQQIFIAFPLINAKNYHTSPTIHSIWSPFALFGIYGWLVGRILGYLLVIWRHLLKVRNVHATSSEHHLLFANGKK